MENQIRKLEKIPVDALPGFGNWRDSIIAESRKSTNIESCDFMQRNSYAEVHDVTAPILQQQTPILNRIGKLIWE